MKINNFFTQNLIFFILLLSALLRFWNLSNIPPHMTPDEASLGYNAYSILKTGRDEYGQFLPLVFKSFGDYKPGLYVYLTVPSVAIFGLNEFSTRFPSALVGVLIVYLTYLITKSFFGQKTGLITSFIASVTPWLIYFSRGAWEANISLALVLLGTYLFIKSFENNKYVVGSIVSFALTLIAYQGAKISTAIVVVLLFTLYFDKIKKFEKKYVFSGLFLGLIVSLPILMSLVNGSVGRLEVFSIFSYPRPTEYVQAILDKGGEKLGDPYYYLFHSESQSFSSGIMWRWFNHFSGSFLFFSGDTANPRHTAPYQGVLLISDMFLLVLGLFTVFKDRISKEKLFFLLWLFLAPLPSILSRDQMHAVRSLNMVIPLIVVCSFGLGLLLEIVNKSKYKLICFMVIGGVYIASFLYFLDAYFIHVPKHSSNLWQYGYKQIVETITPVQNNYKIVKVQQSFAQPYIYFLFFQKYDPHKYQKSAILSESEYKFDVGYVTKLDNIEFINIDWSLERNSHESLIVTDAVKITEDDIKKSSNVNLIKEIKYLNNRDAAFRIVETK